MEKVKFGEFRLDSVMDISSSKSHINKNALQNSDLGGDIPYVTRSTSNNGVSDYIKRYLDDETYLNAARQITIAMDTYVMYYQSRAFYTGNRVKIGVPKFEGYSDDMAEYLITAFNKAVEAFSWGHNMDAGQLEAIKVTLPMIDEDTPDWEYMDNYVKDVKVRRLKIIEDFVDKELTEIIEMKVLEDVEFGEFRLDSILTLTSTKGFDKGELSFIEDGVAFVGRSHENNGIQGRVERMAIDPNEPFSITASVVGAKYALLQTEEYYCSQNINKLILINPDYRKNENILFYMVSAVQKTLDKWADQYGGYLQSELNASLLTLPMIDPETPDWDFMDSYMQRIESEKKDLIRQFVENAGS